MSAAAAAAARGAALHVLPPAIEAGLKRMHALMVIDGRLDEPMRLGIVAGFDSACWHYDDGVHYVHVGTAFAQHYFREDLDEQQVLAGARLLLHHERSHALYTERDGERLTRALDLLGLPFEAWNDFEDVRCEARYAAECPPGDEVRFAWYELSESVDAGALTPGSEAVADPALAMDAVRCIAHHAGDADLAEAVFAAHPATFALARALYAECIAQPDSIELARWVVKNLPEAERRAYAERPRPARGGTRPDLGLQAQPPGPARDAAIERIRQASRDAGEPPAEAPPPGAEAAEAAAPPPPPPPRRPVRIADATTDYGLHQDVALDVLLSDEPAVDLDAARVARLGAMLATLRGRPALVSRSKRTPGGRLSVRDVVAGRGPFRVNERRGRAVAARDVLLVGDVSGSMRGKPLWVLAHLIAGLSRAAEQSLITGNVMLSTTGTDAAFSTCQALPWKDSTTQRLATFGAEGLATTLRARDALVQRADLVVVYTDANIHGRPIDHAAYAREGVQIVGAYCCEDDEQPERADQMRHHFSQFFVRRSVESLVEAIVRERLTAR